MSDWILCFIDHFYMNGIITDLLTPSAKKCDRIIVYQFYESSSCVVYTLFLHIVFTMISDSPLLLPTSRTIELLLRSGPVPSILLCLPCGKRGSSVCSAYWFELSSLQKKLLNIGIAFSSLSFLIPVSEWLIILGNKKAIFYLYC